MTMTLPETRHSLLVQLHNRDNSTAWEEFVRIYEPAMYRFARRRGMQHADAVELAQDVMSRLIKVIPEWEQRESRGSFRSWLFTVARSRLVDAWRARARREAAFGTSTSDASLELTATPDQDDLNTEIRQELIRQASEQIRPEFHENSWTAFQRTTVGGEEIATVAQDLGMTPGSIYAARSRILARLRDVVRRQWNEIEGFQGVTT